MTSGQGTIRTTFAALALMFAVSFVPPVHAQQPPSGANPTASSVNEDQLFKQAPEISGRISIPDDKAKVLIQPQGRDYRGFREGALPWIGGVAVLGMLLALAAFYFTRGRIMLEEGEKSGVRIQRFNAFERFTHWMTATCFIVLAISGLNYIFGKRLLMPLIGPNAFASWSQWAKYAHNFLSWPFMLGVLLMLAVWLKDNLPDHYDLAWLKRAGGLRGGGHPPAGRFNAGQKLMFWSVVLGGLALSATGIMMLFPFSLLDISGMQWTQYIHATIGVLLIAVMLAHIYIGSIGMEGAFDAMESGEVDLAWVKANHAGWLDDKQAKAARAAQISGSAAE